MAPHNVSSITPDRDYYYPEVLFNKVNLVDRCKYFLHTLVRKKYNGIWYDIRFNMQYEFSDVDMLEHGEVSVVSEIISRFHMQAYNIINLHVFTDEVLDQVDAFGHRLYKVSETQISEAERLILLMP